MDNILLKALYTEFCHSKAIDPELAGKCSLPLLLHIGPSWGGGSQKRVLVVGQETLAWQFRPGEYEWKYGLVTSYPELVAIRGIDHIDVLMDGYRRFEFAKYETAHANSPFWRAFREFNSLSGTSTLWTNLVRCSVNNGSVIRNCTEAQLDHLLSAQRGVLAKEIRLLQPTAVVFFTGPNYDRILCDEFLDLSFHAVQGHKERQFSKVQAKGLPSRSFRVYHPGYLVRSRRWNWINELKQLVVE